jgi:sugar transferase (PEP-CTERM system associated)
MIFIFGEGMLIFCSIGLASFLLLGKDLGESNLLEVVWMKIFLVSFVAQLSLYFNDLYEFKINQNAVDLLTRLMQSIGMTSITLAIIYFLWPGAIIGRWIFFFSLILLLFSLLSWRFLYSLVIRKKLFTEKSIIVGSGELARDILKEINDRGDVSWDIRLILSHEKENNSKIRLDGIPVRRGFTDLFGRAQSRNATSIIVALDQKRGIMPTQELLNCRTRGISIIDGETFYERISKKLILERISPSWLIFSDGFVKSRISKLTKRLVGLFFSLIMLIISSPLMLFFALAIKLDSRGPIFFSQERVGETEGIFVLYKFRSMRCDAEEETGPIWACDDDPRVTRVGRIIRKLHVDEMPQLWNVLKGDISFVGPRPERPFFVQRLKKTVPYYKERFTVKPGITGWAQINFGYASSEEEALQKLKYDLYYIKNMSWIMDLVIVFHTIKIALLGRGAK